MLEATKNLRIYAGEGCPAYVYGRTANMLRHGGPWDPNDPDPGDWTEGDLEEKATHPNHPADPKKLVATTTDEFGGEEAHHIPEKRVSNPKYFGKIVKRCIIAGWTRDQILDALNDKQNVGGSWFRWRLVKGERSAMKFFEQTLTIMEVAGGWVLEPNTESVTEVVHPNLGWIDPTVCVTNSDTGEVSTLGETGYYLRMISRYLKKKDVMNDVMDDEGMKKDDEGISLTKHPRECLVSDIHDDDIDTTPTTNITGPVQVNGNGKSYPVNVDTVCNLWEHLKVHSDHTIKELRDAHLAPPGAYLDPARDYLEEYGFLERVKVKSAKPGRSPKGHRLTGKTDEEFQSFLRERWGDNLVSFGTVYGIIKKLRDASYDDDLFPGLPMADLGREHVVSFLLDEGILTPRRQRGSDIPLYSLVSPNWDNLDPWMVERWGDEAQRKIDRRKSYANKKVREREAAVKAAQEAAAEANRKPTDEEREAARAALRAELQAQLAAIEAEEAKELEAKEQQEAKRKAKNDSRPLTREDIINLFNEDWDAA